MQNSYLIAILAGLSGMLGWGLADFFAKKTVDRVGSLVSLVWAHLFGTIALTLVVLYRSTILSLPISLPSDLSQWLLLAFFGTLQAVVYLLAYEGFRKGQLSIMNPLFASYSGLVALFSIGIFGEQVGGPVVIALAVIFAGIIMLNLDFEALKIRRLNLTKTPGLKEIAGASLLAAIWTLSWDKFVNGQDWLAYALLMYAFMTLAAFSAAKFQKVDLSVVRKSLVKFLILIGVCEVIAYVGISLGFSVTTHTSIVALLSGAFSLPTIILARIFLKEKVNTFQTVGSLVIIAGILILSI